MPHASLIILLSACAADVAVGVPWLDAPAAVELDGAVVGKRTSWGVEVVNSGTETARVTLSVSPPFEVNLDAELVVPPGGVAELPVVLEAHDYEPVAGTLLATTGFQDLSVDLMARVATDADGDGHEALAAGGDDCDDDDPDRFPTAVEVCNEVDDDCSGVVDDLDPPAMWWPDADDDGSGDAFGEAVEGCERPPGYVDDDSDCDDSDASVGPAAAEVWYDGIDQDCDGLSDFDRDQDGYDSAAHGGTDCRDDDLGVHPDAPEVWYDGVDQDCDGNDDDQDLDGSGIDFDCDDLDPGVAPNLPELDDGIDQDCDGLIDEDFLGRGSLLLTEVMVDPVAVADNAGRYVEVHNPTDGHVDLAGISVTVGSQVTLLPAQYMNPGGVAVLCVETDPLLNGGVTCAGSVTWTGAANRVELADGVGLVIDEVLFQGWTVPVGASLELASDQLDPDANDLEASWCPAEVDLGSGDLGTPGVLSPPCP